MVSSSARRPPWVPAGSLTPCVRATEAIRLSGTASVVAAAEGMSSEIGRASGRERVWISEDAGALEKKEGGRGEPVRGGRGSRWGGARHDRERDRAVEREQE